MTLNVAKENEEKSEVYKSLFHKGSKDRKDRDLFITGAHSIQYRINRSSFYLELNSGNIHASECHFNYELKPLRKS
jgi:hypothetical protein